MPRKKNEAIPPELLPLLKRKYSLALACGCIIETEFPASFIELAALRDETRKNHQCEKKAPSE